MSGGFFRGTTADQDTRFSNKQAKLMKSQKFPPELEHLVDMSKVKMDVVRPWIAKRVTELLGFEDEVLINFIYGLLDGKNVNGKEIQISITGFMEKNTGKFMRELWTLLLSAQKNASGVPQQFLDEKEEETKTKMAESERITNEIQRKKEREAEESGFDPKRMEGGSDTSRHKTTSVKLFANHRNGRELSHSPDEKNEIVGRNGRDRKTRFSRSTHSTGSSLSPRRSRSRSSSRSPKARKRSMSTERERPNQRRSISPHRSRLSRRSPSLSRGRSSYRRRSRSRSRSRSLSPQQFRSHRNTSPRARRRWSPSSLRHRSRSPVRRRSPPRRSRRSPSPVRRRSPPRRSPSSVRRRSPPRRSLSPVRRRSPRSRSQSPVRRDSRAMIRRQSHSPVQDKSPLLPRRRGSTSSPSQGATPSPKHTSLSPQRRRSPPPRNRLSPPTRRRTPPIAHERNIQISPKARRYRGQSPDSCKSLPADGRKKQSPDSRSVSPDRSAYVPPFCRTSVSPSREKSPIRTKKLIVSSSKENHRLVRESHKESKFIREDESVDPEKEAPSKETSPRKTILSSEPRANRKWDHGDEPRSLNSSKRDESKIRKDSPPLVMKEKYFAKGNVSHELIGKGASAASSDSGLDDGKKRKNRGSSSKHEVTSDEDSLDVDANETKDARRKRKKEEKRLRREKRHLRHEEKRRKKEERRSEKHKSMKEDDSSVAKKVYEKSDVEEEDEEKKKLLEVELRKKALESLKAKKGI